MQATLTDANAILANRKLTPMLRQYLEAKTACPEAILMFRMGDFFELFFEDAKIAARELDLTLTAREKNDDPIPMAGVPHHAINTYIARLVERGYTVALCDQVEDPRKAKGLVKREITRLITPGTVSDLEALDPGSANYLAAVDRCETTGGFAIALMDLLAGELLCTRAEAGLLSDELRRMGVREVLCDDMLRAQLITGINDERVSVRAIDMRSLDENQANGVLVERFGANFGKDLPTGGGASECRALVQIILYAERTQRRKLQHLMAPKAYRVSDYLVLDEATRRNLELCRTRIENRRRGSLLWHMDKTRTAVGARLLNQWLLFPLRQRAPIDARLDAVQFFKAERPLRTEIQAALEGVRDIERLVGRVAVGRANPRDAGALLQSLQQLPALKDQMGQQTTSLGEAWRDIDVVPDLRAELGRALADDLPVSGADGGIFKRGYRDDLDELITLSTDGHAYLADLEQRERKRSGISNLKVRYNRVFGYYIEITKANLAQVPSDFVRKQTLVNAERFITDELKDFEEKVLDADERRKERELELFTELISTIASHGIKLRAVSRVIAETDALAALGQVADECRYVRPEICEESALVLTEARHAVLEQLLPNGERFVPNDVHLNVEDRQLMIVTGPNMAGKSTVMRQTALCVVMAHMGGFVPAKSARIGLCDRLFTRVGAADNLGRGHSTFMVEMMETATILKHATARSLVLLDEIGRGTSTYDGVSIAWAVAEYLHDAVGCRAMFATHYHELTDLAADKPRIINASVEVKEDADEVIFLRRLVDVAADRSYGIQVARLAGVPDAVLSRAREILSGLEAQHAQQAPQSPAQATAVTAAAAGLESTDPIVRAARRQLSLFTPPTPITAPVPQRSRVEEAVAKFDINKMTPLDAMSALHKLQKLLP